MRDAANVPRVEADWPHQAQPQVGGGEIGADGVAAVRGGVVPDNDEGFWVAGAHVPEEGQR